MLVCVQVVNTGLIASASETGQTLLDFINNSYRHDGVAYGAAEAIDRPELITSNGLEVPAQSANGDEINLLAPFKSAFSDGYFTILIELTIRPAPNNNSVDVFRGVDVVGSFSDFLGLDTSTTFTSVFNDGNPSGTQIDSFFGATPVGTHTYAITFDATHIAISVDGSAVQTDGYVSSTFAINFVAIGGFPGDGTDDAFYMRKMKIWANPLDDSALPSLTFD